MLEKRIQSVRENMRRDGLPQIIVSSPHSIYYLTGHFVEPGERLLALLIQESGQPTLFINSLFQLGDIPGIACVYHRDTQDPVERMAEALRPGAVGIDKFWPSQFLLRLLGKRSDLTPKLGSAPVDDARMIKDAKEIEAMARASAINDEVIAAVPGILASAPSELAAARAIGAAFQRLGDAAHPAWTIVCYGKNAAEPHHANDDTALKPGDAIVVDQGQNSFGYNSDMTRTFFYRSVSDEQRKVYDIVREANRRASEMVKPGVTFAQVDAAARDYIAAQGYGEFFTHRTGHGIGLEVHEFPDVSAANQMELRPGMMFSIEPGIYLPGKFGVRIEDLVLVTESGVRVLNEYTKDLTVID